MDSEVNLHSVISHAEFKGITEACRQILDLESMAQRMAMTSPTTANTLRKLAKEEIEGMVNYCAEVERTAEDLLRQQEEDRKRAIVDGDGLYVEGTPMADVGASDNRDEASGTGRVPEVRDVEEESPGSEPADRDGGDDAVPPEAEA